MLLWLMSRTLLCSQQRCSTSGETVDPQTSSASMTAGSKPWMSYTLREGHSQRGRDYVWRYTVFVTSTLPWEMGLCSTLYSDRAEIPQKNLIVFEPPGISRAWVILASGGFLKRHPSSLFPDIEAVSVNSDRACTWPMIATSSSQSSGELRMIHNEPIHR